MNDITWVDVGGGKIALGHRPKLKKMRDLKEAGATHVLTLLSGSEGAGQIGSAVNQAEMRWLWLPLGSGDPEHAPVEDARVMFDRLKDILEEGHHVYIHCSAGIHRTGMIANAFFRFSGKTAEESEALIAELRTHTAEGVGEHRLAWGDQFAPRPEGT